MGFVVGIVLDGGTGDYACGVAYVPRPVVVKDYILRSFRVCLSGSRCIRRPTDGMRRRHKKAVIGVLYHQRAVGVRVEVVVPYAPEVVGIKHLSGNIFAFVPHFPEQSVGGRLVGGGAMPLLPILAAATEKSRRMYHLFISVISFSF